MKTNSDTTPKLYIGLDVHKEQTSVAIADPGSDGEVRSHGNISTTQPSIDKTLRRIAKARGLLLTDLHVCYEAGGCGMWIGGSSNGNSGLFNSRARLTTVRCGS